MCIRWISMLDQEIYNTKSVWADPRNYMLERTTQIYAYYVLYTVGGM